MSSAFIVSMEKRISTGAMSLRAFARSRRRTLIAMKAPEIDWAKTRTSASMLAEPNSALVIPAASMLPSIAGGGQAEPASDEPACDPYEQRERNCQHSDSLSPKTNVEVLR